MGIDFVAVSDNDDLFDLYCQADQIDGYTLSLYQHVCDAIKLLPPGSNRFDIEYAIAYHDYPNTNGMISRLYDMFSGQYGRIHYIQLGNARVLRRAIAHYHPELCTEGFSYTGESRDKNCILGCLQTALGYEMGNAIAPYIAYIKWS